MPLSSSDITEIQQLYGVYGHLIDGGDAKAFSELFVEDGVLTSGGKALVGTEEIRQFAERVHQRAPETRHAMINIYAEGEGDSAQGRAYLLVYSASPEGPVLRASGCYADALQRIDGSWKFAKRDCTMDA